MKRREIALGLAFALLWATPAAAQGNPAKGAAAFRNCLSCHALEPGLHLSGPSLANMFGRAAGSVEGFARYSNGLKTAGFDWNAASLDGWLKSPRDMIPDTYMVFRCIEEAAARSDLIAFLAVAGVPGGADLAVSSGLIPADWLRGSAPDSVRAAPQSARVTAIRHCGDSYFVSTADGRVTPFWEKNLRLKIDSVETGPEPGIAVVQSAGMGGDRSSVIFAGLEDLKSLIEQKCEN